jgi:hypothetical protein
MVLRIFNNNNNNNNNKAGNEGNVGIGLHIGALLCGYTIRDLIFRFQMYQADGSQYRYEYPKYDHDVKMSWERPDLG